MKYTFTVSSVLLVLATSVAWTSIPSRASAQSCRRSCEADESRDVRGCCVPKAEPKPAKKEQKPAEDTASAQPPKNTPRPPRPQAEAHTARERKSPTRRRPSQPSPDAPSLPQRSESLDQSGEVPTARSLEPRRKAPNDQNERTNRPASASLNEPEITTEAKPPAPLGGFNATANSSTQAPVRVHEVPDYAMATGPQRDPRVHHRWPTWLLWSITGTGLAITGIGGWLYTLAARRYEDFDSEFDRRCPDTGCPDYEFPHLTDYLDSARRLETVWRISIIVGSTTLATGVVVLYLNRGATRAEQNSMQTFIVPTFSPNAASVVLGTRF